jgi:hypothetical protein
VASLKLEKSSALDLCVARNAARRQYAGMVALSDSQLKIIMDAAA